jgi:hypothetical protein
MTYLNIVNNVLKRLREDTVTTVDESDYSSLIGVFVNDARILVEDAWQWSALKTTVNFDTVVGQSKYALTDIDYRSEVLRVLDTSDKRELKYQPSREFRLERMISDNPNSKPLYYTFNDTDANGDLNIEITPNPDSIRTIDVDVVKRSKELTNDSDTLEIPSNPVQQLAYAMAIQERGEAGGMSSAQQFTIAQRAIQDAIALDATKHPEELTWYYQ